MRVKPRSTDYQDEPSIEFPDCTSIAEHTITITPRYSETDQAGIVHHTVYPIWFEMGRTELLRANGLAYSELEKAGVFFVISELTAKYRRPCFYDEALELITSCSRITPGRVEHTYTLKRPETDIVLAEGTSTLACVDKQGRVRRMPKFMYPGE